MYEFAKSSIKHLSTVHEDIALIAYTVKKWCNVDFDISCGHRTAKEQNELYQIGRTIQLDKRPITQIDGIKEMSMHNYYPSRAIDIYAYSGAKASYTVEDLSYLAGFFCAAAAHLKQQGKIKHDIIWGGCDEWVNDGFIDMPHFELEEI